MSKSISIPNLFYEIVKFHERDLALVDKLNQFTYLDLFKFAMSVKNCLAENSFNNNINDLDFSALCADKSCLSISTIFGIMCAGNTYLPIDPDYPDERILYILKDSKVSNIFVDNKNEVKIKKIIQDNQINCKTINIEKLVILTNVNQSANSSIEASKIAYMIYTSGTTGDPKGVLINYNNLSSLLSWTARSTKSLECKSTLQYAPLSFDPSILEIFTTLLSGNTLYIIDSDQRREISSLLLFIDKYKIERLFIPISILNLLADESIDSNIKLDFVKEINCGGDVMIITENIRQALSQNKNIIINNQYGPTEAAIMVTNLKISGDSSLWPKMPCIGSSIDGAFLKLDSNEEIGELLISGEMLSPGYWGRPELTNEKFIEIQGIRYYKSGDLVKKIGNNFEFISRIDKQIKINGIRVESGEIESAIQDYLKVEDVFVQIIKHNENKLLVAFIKAEFELSNLKDHLASILPTALIPNRFFKIDTVKLTANGKVDHKSFEEIYFNSLSKPAFIKPENLEMNSTVDEAELLTLISKIINNNNIDINDNFFDIGGTSLQAINLIRQFNRKFKTNKSIVDLYTNPILKSLLSTSKEKINKENRVKNSNTLRKVAVVGMSCRYPNAESVSLFWEMILNKSNGISTFENDEISIKIDRNIIQNSNYVKARGILKNIDMFDSNFFNFSPRVSEVFDPQMRIMLEEAVIALESAGIAPNKTTDVIGVYVGMSNNNYYNQVLETNPDKLDQVGEWPVATYNEKDYIATHIAHKLNLKGPALSIHTACSTSLVTIATAYKAIQNGDCDVAIAGGVNINSLHKVGHQFLEGGIYSSDGHTRSFDKDASGTVFSDGIGLVVLKDLDKAISDGDIIYAIIKGAAINNDGAEKSSFTAPSKEGQKKVIQKALDDAQIDPLTIELIEAHGTATPVGDPIEVQGISEAFEEYTEIENIINPIVLGSVKSQIGHTIAASGAAGFIKMCLALKTKTLTATGHFNELNPLINMGKIPLYINTETKNWETKFELRRAAVSSFGVGGTNAHIILEEFAENRTKTIKENSFELLCYSAKSINSLYQLLLANKEFIVNKKTELDFSAYAQSLYLGRNDLDIRLSFVASNVDELIIELNKCLSSWDVVSKKLGKVKNKKILIGFPGQGVQYEKMGRELYDNDEVYKNNIDLCNDIIIKKFSYDLKNLLIESNSIINNTEFAQISIFVHQYSMAQSLLSLGVRYEILIGHSIGEFVVAVLEGAMSLDDALELVFVRGREMQKQPLGEMVSIRLSKEDVVQLLKNNPILNGIEISAENGKENVVVGGRFEDISKLILHLQNHNIAFKKLITSHAFHTTSMKGVLREFDSILSTIAFKKQIKETISVITTDFSNISFSTKEYWLKHLVQPVLFYPAMKKVLILGPDLILDIGPNIVISTLSKNILREMKKEIEVIALGSNSRILSEYKSYLEGVGKLWEKSIDINLQRIYKKKLLKISLPTYSFERKSYWAGYPLNKQINNSYEINIPKENPMKTVQKKIQNELISIFSESSGIASHEIDVELSYLELGFDSLFLTQIAMDVERHFGIKISFRQLLDEEISVKLLADYIIDKKGITPEAIKVTKIEEIQPVNTYTQPEVQTQVQTKVQQTIVNQPINFETIKNGNNLEMIISQQLELMKAQMNLLSGITSKNVPTVIQANPLVIKETNIIIPKNEIITSEEIKATVDTAKIAFGAQARINTKKESNLNSEIKSNMLNLFKTYIEKTKKSKDFTQKYRAINADPRVVTGFRPEIKEVIYPIVVNKSKGQVLWDIDGNKYIDMICGFGSNFFGNQNERINKALHDQLDQGYEIGPQHELVGECAELICELSKMERAAFCNTGSEAVLGALRISRTITGRKKVVMFKGSYHGINDEVIVRGLKDGSAMPAAAGINKNSVADILVLDYGTEESLARIRSEAHLLAAVIVEPVQSRRADFRPKEFLMELRKITENSGTAFIFDEVITGFRIAPGGAQEYFGIKADLATYGKIIGGGLPIGVIAGRKKFMDALDGGFWSFGDDSAPEVGLTYFAGTFVRHPLALRSMREALLILKEGGRKLYDDINAKADDFVFELNLFADVTGAPLIIDNFGGVLKPRYTHAGDNFDLFFLIMKLKGVHCYDGFPWFVTLGHTDEDLAFVKVIYKESILEMQKLGFFPAKYVASQSSEKDFIIPPVPGAKLGRDENLMPCWFVADAKNPGKMKKV